MLIKGSTVKGLKVIAKQVGKEINAVDDILFNRTDGVVDALLITSGGMFNASAQVLKLRDIDTFGPDAIMIDSDNIIRDVSADSIKNFRAKDIILGKKMVTEDGNQLGSVTDFFFESDTGQIQKFEVSEGILNDLKGGRKEINAAGVTHVGDDTILVTSSVKQEVEAEPDNGGMTAIFNKAKEKTQETYSQVKEAVDEKKEQLEEKPESKPAPTIGMDEMARFSPIMSANPYPPVPSVPPAFQTKPTQPLIAPTQSMATIPTMRYQSSGPQQNASTSTSVRDDLDELTQQASDAAERIKHEAQIMKDFVAGTAEEIKDQLDD